MHRTKLTIYETFRDHLLEDPQLPNLVIMILLVYLDGSGAK